MRETIKKKLVDHMLANGNDFSYTEMIEFILKTNYGKAYRYDHTSSDRGYYATNFSKKWNGYMVNGKGPCGVYKNENGRYSATYYKKVDKMEEKNIYKKLFDTVEEAGKLIAKFGNISIPATVKKTPNGKYIVTFKI